MEHPVAWQFRRRGLPLVVVAETEMWRKVRDVNGDEVWVRKAALSGERFVITTTTSHLRNKPQRDSRLVAIADPMTIVKLETCETSGWCKIKAQSGQKGWIREKDLWGTESLD